MSLTFGLLDAVALLLSHDHEISATFVNKFAERGVWGRGFVVFFFWALLLLAYIQVTFVFPKSYIHSGIWLTIHY